jgi:hypothetical protein
MPSVAVLTVRVRFKWWLIPYIRTLIFACYVLDTEPDWEKLERVVRLAVRIEGLE